ncbi:MAG: serine/threonine protein kinase [Calothrix sp. CSU_2_0]|nr:serine/threonine protein kinase [Calothrix sp. CSU_2_0]
MDTQIPDGKILLGCYEIQRFLGRGGFGETYKAIDKLKMDSCCVIKRLKPKKTDDDTLKAARTLFKREAQFLYKLGSHNQIPRLLADFEEEEEFYLAQEYIPGEDFKKELEFFKQLSETQVIDFLQDVLHILKFVHQHHVIHRDIKPSNLIRRRSDGKFVLIDFGSVKQISTQETSSDGLTSSTIAVGTRGYMPNEQQGGKPRPSSDIYALGMTAIHALTGIAPIDLKEDSRTGEVIWHHLAANINKRLVAILDKWCDRITQTVTMMLMRS